MVYSDVASYDIVAVKRIHFESERPNIISNSLALTWDTYFNCEIFLKGSTTRVDYQITLLIYKLNKSK
jgi:hypothetical protein